MTTANNQLMLRYRFCSIETTHSKDATMTLAGCGEEHPATV